MLSNRANNAGINIMPTRVAAIMPKNTVTPIDICELAPGPVAITIGKTPRINVIAVIKTARNLSPAPFSEASRILKPCSR